MNGCGLACFVFVLLGMSEIFYGKYIFYNSNDYFAVFFNTFGKHYPVVAFSNTNDLSQFLVLLFPCCYYFLKSKKIIWLIYLVLSFFVIFNTESKLSLISYVSIIVLSYTVYTNSIKSNGKLKNVVIAILFIIGILIIDSYTNFISITIERFFNISISADYYVGRSNIYVKLFELSKKLPFGGFGSAYAIQIMPPHNLMLYILCDYGWCAFVLFVLFLFNIVKRVYKNVLESAKNDKFFYSLVFTNLLFFVILSSVSSCNEQRKAIWIFLGICIRIAYYKNIKLNMKEAERNEIINRDDQ